VLAVDIVDVSVVVVEVEFEDVDAVDVSVVAVDIDVMVKDDVSVRVVNCVLPVVVVAEESFVTGVVDMVVSGISVEVHVQVHESGQTQLTCAWRL
jgi:hypothetical protein